MTASATSIGRFRILKTLGRGAQGEVFLAEDTRLKRKVAIKTLQVHGRTNQERKAEIKALLEESTIVSQLAHPNIVPLFDAGEENGLPYLVFEFVEGRTLQAQIRDMGPLPPARAVDLTIQILKAMGYAHQKGIVHRDLKPANLMLQGDVVRVMDFGVAQLVTKDLSDEEAFAGTPAYMAPEYIDRKIYTTRSDLFAVGMVLYETLTGHPAVTGQNVFETLHRIVNEPFPPPSEANPAVDERVDDIVLRALAKAPEDRFASAEEMENALYLYLNPEELRDTTQPLDSQQGTLDFLLRRMRHRSDFPALTSTISALNKATSSEGEPLTTLSSCILKDFALTNKLLKLVNTAYYSQFGGSVSTVSRAVLVMGYDSTRQVALTLMLFEHLQNKAQAAHLRDEILASYFSGILGRLLVPRVGIKDSEEGFISSLLHPLGKLLTAFYFHEEYVEIQKLILSKGFNENRASHDVMGVTYEDLAVAVAQYWHFPEQLVESLRELPDEEVKAPSNDVDALRIVADACAAVCGAIRITNPQKRDAAFEKIHKRFGEVLDLDQKELIDRIKEAGQALVVDTSLLNFRPSNNPFYLALTSFIKGHTPEEVAPANRNDLTFVIADATLKTLAPGQLHGSVPVGSERDPRNILSAGIQDITTSLAGKHELNDILRMILETMFRAINFTRVLLCVRDSGHNCLRSRFGFGAEIDRIIKGGFNIPLDVSNDVFGAALSTGADIYIEDVDSDRIREHIPDWYRNLITAKSLALFPVMVHKRPVALFYGDSDKAGDLRLAQGELSLLKTLRNQAILAIRQRG